MQISNKESKKEDTMDEKDMIEELVKMLDKGITNGVGHFNVEVDDTETTQTNVQTMGCSDCSRTPLACSVPTLQEGLDDFH